MTLLQCLALFILWGIYLYFVIADMPAELKMEGNQFMPWLVATAMFTLLTIVTILFINMLLGL